MKPISFNAKLVISFLIAFSLLGLWGSLNSGLSWDDPMEHNLFILNYKAVEGLLNGSKEHYLILAQYFDRYYGMGFHAIAYFFARLFNTQHSNSDALSLDQDLMQIRSDLELMTIQHIPVFICFVLTGFLVKLIIQSITKSQKLSVAAMICFLLWPYLLGHALMNIKDSPFAFAWLLSTFWALKLFDQINRYVTEQKAALCKKIRINILILALLCAWLVSIRISGVLIFAELLIFCAFIIWKNYRYFLSSIISSKRLMSSEVFVNAILFCAIFLFATYLLYPLFWINPYEFINAILYKVNNPIEIDTLTAGNLVPYNSTGLRYLGYWLLVKLPAIVLFGLAIVPLVFFKASRISAMDCTNEEVKNNDGLLKIAVLLISVFFILALLRIKHVPLYNELRHILFLFPLIFIASISALYFWKKYICFFLLWSSSGIFAIDDIKLHPYQYTYLNEIARFLPISELFEKDYFALSVKPTTEWLNKNSISFEGCIYSSPLHTWTAYIDLYRFNCNEAYPAGGFQMAKRPFLVYGQVRNPNTPFPINNCKLLNLQERRLFASPYRLQMSRLYLCY
jgi:hypothetical protein